MTHDEEVMLGVLKDVRLLLENKQHWTQFDAARDEHGAPVGARDSSACRWCLVGAVGMKSPTSDSMFFKVTDLLDQVAHDEFRGISAISVNDRLGHDAAMKLLDMVITRLEER